MNRLSLSNNRLRFRGLGELPIILEEFMEYALNECRNMKDHNCNQLDLKTLGWNLDLQPVISKIQPVHLWWVIFWTS